MENFGKIARLLFRCIFYLKPCVYFYVSYVYNNPKRELDQKQKKVCSLPILRKIKISNII